LLAAGIVAMTMRVTNVSNLFVWRLPSVHATTLSRVVYSPCASTARLLGERNDTKIDSDVQNKRSNLALFYLALFDPP